MLAFRSLTIPKEKWGTTRSLTIRDGQECLKIASECPEVASELVGISFTENIEAICDGSFKIRAKIEIREQFSVRLSSQTSLLMSCYMSGDMFLQSASQFGFLPSKPCLFPPKSSLEFVLHHVKPKFISLPVKFPVDRSKFQFCTTARSKLIIVFTRTVLPFLCFFSKSSG